MVVLYLHLGYFDPGHCMCVMYESFVSVLQQCCLYSHDIYVQVSINRGSGGWRGLSVDQVMGR